MSIDTLERLHVDPATLIVPAYLMVPEFDYTLGPLVADISALGGIPPDPEQQVGLDAVFGERLGLPAVTSGLLVGPRQNFKSINLEQIELGWMFVTCEPGATWSAHQHKTARANFEHVAAMIEATPALSRHVVKILDGQGDEMIELKGGRFNEGRQFPFVTRSTRAGRGRAFGKQIWDEYLFVTKQHEGTLLPAQTTFPDRQRIGATSAGIGMSARARAMRDRGRRGDLSLDPRFYYIEYCDDLPGACAAGEECSHLYGVDGCRYDDEARYRRANLGVARGRITIEYIEDERKDLDPAEFGRERLGYWDDPDESDDLVGIDDDTWEELEDVDSEIEGEPVFGLDVNPKRTWSTIVAAGLNVEGRKHVEVSVRRTKSGDLEPDHRPGTTWVLRRFRRLLKLYPALRVRLLDKSQAATFGPRLAELGCNVEYVQPGDWPELVADMVDAIALHELVHIGQVELSTAASSVVLVPVGEERSRWGRRKSAGEIGPIMGATAALSGVNEGGSAYESNRLEVV